MKKTNKLISILLVMAMLLSMAPLTVLAAENLTDTTTSVTLKDADGNGLYEIGTAAELYAFANLVNAGNTSVSVELTADITLNENVLKEDGTLNGDGTNFTPWVPIGGSENNFAGVFDGKKHTISGLYYNGTDTYVGLFGGVDGKYQSDTIGVIKNIAIVDSYLKTTISGNNVWVRVGGIAGFASSYSLFQDCFAKATLEVDNSKGCKLCIGGIAGMTYANAVNCCTDVVINYNDDTMAKSIGGILASVTNGSFVNCHTNYSTLGEYNTGTEVTGCSINVTDEQFASGEITYLLNGSKAESGSVWKQTLGEDNYPSFNGKYVDYDESRGYYNLAHMHSFEYSDDGDTITATCTAKDCYLNNADGGTLKISAPADLYADGTTAKKATVENNLVDTSVTVGDITYSTADGTAPKTAGTYTASVIVGGATATVEFTLLNYAAKVTDKDGNAVGNYKTFADAVTAAQGSEGSTLTLLDDITLTEMVRIFSGKFTLDLNGKTILNKTDDVLMVYYDANITIKDSCEGGTVETGGDYCSGIINSAELTVESGTVKGQGAAITNNGTLTVNGGNFEAYTYGAITNKGTAKIYGGVFEGIDRGEGIQNDASGEIYIYGGKIIGNTALLNTGTAYISGGEFNGNSYAALNLLRGTVEVTGGSFTGTDFSDGYFSGTPYGEWTVDFNSEATFTLKGGEFPNGFVVDETTANTVLAEDYYYKDADGKLIDVAEDSTVINGYVKVSKGADLADSVITLDSTEFTYNGSEIKPTVIVTIGGKTLTEGKDYTLTFANNVNAGTATVTVTGAGDYTGEATKVFTIVKADNTVNAAPTPNTLTYKGEAQNLIAAGEATGGTMVYSLDGAEYSETIPQGTDAGDYTVFYKVIGDANHNDTEPETLTVTIGKKSVTAIATVPDKVYDGTINLDLSKVEITFDGIADGDTIEYEVLGGSYFTADAGENIKVAISYDVSGEDVDNYDLNAGMIGTPEANFAVMTKANILPRDIADAQIVLGDALTYNGAEQTQTVAAVTVDGLEVTYTVSGNKATNVGVYELTITGNGNFAGETTALYEIAPDTTGIDVLAVDNVKSSDKEAIEAVAQQIENAVTDLADDEKKAEYKAITDKCDELLSKNNDTANEIERIDEAVNSYDKETVTSADIPELGKLIEDIKALTDGDNITEDEKAALEEADKAIDELVEKLAEVAEEIKRVDEAVKSYDEETVKSSDSDELAQLKEDIQSLIDSDNTTENEKTALEEMIKDIEGLEDKITETEEKLEEIKGIENNFNPENVSSDDKAAIEDKIADIEAINPDNLTDEQKAEYEEIKAGFEVLLEEIAAAEKAVEDIGIELEMFDEKRVTIFREDDIEALKAKIDELLADENMGEAEKAKLNEYKAQAEKLIEIINTPKEYFSLRLFYFVWDALHWLSSHVVFIFNWIAAMF